MLTKTDWAYAAAMIDAEGCITMGFGKAQWQGKYEMKTYLRPALQISVVNTYKPLLDWFLQSFGGKLYEVKRLAASHKTQWHWYIIRKEAREKFLLGILPYLKEKAPQARLALEWVRIDGKNHEMRKQLADECQKLNRRESVTTNTSNSVESAEKIESGLTSNRESAPEVTQDA